MSAPGRQNRIRKLRRRAGTQTNQFTHGRPSAYPLSLWKMLPIPSTTAEPGELAEVIQGQKITRKPTISTKQNIPRKFLSQKMLASKKIPQNQIFLHWCRLP